MGALVDQHVVQPLYDAMKNADEITNNIFGDESGGDSEEEEEEILAGIV